MRFFKVEEIDEDTFTKQAGSYESIFVSGSQNEVRTERYMRS